METAVTETKKTKKSKKNGAATSEAAGETVMETKTEAPQEVQLDREDILSLTLITEKSRRLEAESGRIAAERRALENENLLYVQGLNSKYGVDMNGYSIDLEVGVARPRTNG